MIHDLRCSSTRRVLVGNRGLAAGWPKGKAENLPVTGSDDFSVLDEPRPCFCTLSPLEPSLGPVPLPARVPPLHQAAGRAGRGLRHTPPRPLMHYYSKPLVSL